MVMPRKGKGVSDARGVVANATRPVGHTLRS
jgi:hypothetical protein